MYYNVFGDKVSKTRFKEMENTEKNCRELTVTVAPRHTRYDLLKMGALADAGCLVTKSGLSARAWGQTTTLGPINQPAIPATRAFVTQMPIPLVHQPVKKLTPAPTVALNTATEEGRAQLHQALKSLETNAGQGATRRTALKLRTAAGAVTVLTSRKSFTLPPGGPPPPEPTVCSPQPTHSPATTPFFQALPIPPIARPFKLNLAPTKSANLAAGEAPRADHQHWEEFLPQDQYDFAPVPANHTFHPDMGATYCWTYNGIYPGPTIIGQYGIPVLVRSRNNLPVDHNGFGSNTRTTQLHNGHTASESDGFAGDFWGPGFFKDHHYPNIDAGYDTFGGNGDPREATCTFWYHDHRHSFTATNNYRGLNGMFLLYDNMLEHPVEKDSLELHASSSYDVVIDFSDVPIGQSIYLSNIAPQFVSNAPEPLPSPNVNISNIVMRFDATSTAQNHSQVPDTLCQYRDLNLNEVVTTRLWNFNLKNGQFKINGLIFDANRADDTLKRGTAETWIIRNKLPASGWIHPVHIHLEEGRILSRNGAPPPEESGRRDPYPIRLGEEVLIFLCFREWFGKYMIHCHNLVYEDHAMMLLWFIDPNGGDSADPARMTFYPLPAFEQPRSRTFHFDCLHDQSSVSGTFMDCNTIKYSPDKTAACLREKVLNDRTYRWKNRQSEREDSNIEEVHYDLSKLQH